MDSFEHSQNIPSNGLNGDPRTQSDKYGIHKASNGSLMHRVIEKETETNGWKMLVSIAVLARFPVRSYLGLGYIWKLNDLVTFLET